MPLKEQCAVHAGEEDHASPGRTTSRRGQDSQWKSLSEWQDSDKWRKYVHGVANPRIETAKEQNRKVFQYYYKLDIVLVNNQAVSTHSFV